MNNQKKSSMEMPVCFYDTFFKVKEYSGMDSLPTSLVLHFVDDSYDRKYDITITDDSDETELDFCVRMYMVNDLTQKDHHVIESMISKSERFKERIKFMEREGIPVTRGTLFVAACLQALGMVYIDNLKKQYKLNPKLNINREELLQDNSLKEVNMLVDHLIPHYQEGSYLVIYHLKHILTKINVKELDEMIISFEEEVVLKPREVKKFESLMSDIEDFFECNPQYDTDEVFIRSTSQNSLVRLSMDDDDGDYMMYSNIKMQDSIIRISDWGYEEDEFVDRKKGNRWNDPTYLLLGLIAKFVVSGYSVQLDSNSVKKALNNLTTFEAINDKRIAPGRIYKVETCKDEGHMLFSLA